MRSDTIKKGDHQVPARSLSHAAGTLKSPTDMNKPFVTVCNPYIDIVPGHVHLKELADIVKEAIREADTIPFEFNTTGVDDEIAMGHTDMKYSLLSHEIIVNATGTAIGAHWFDGISCIPNCDKITPGVLLAATRTNVPVIFYLGGPMETGLPAQGKALTLSSMSKAVRAFKEGSITKEEFLDMEQNTCPTCGSCVGVSTANPMNCLMEVLGLAFPYNGTALAVSDQHREMIRQAAFQLVENIKSDIKSRDIVTKEATDDAFALDMATGGSTDTVLHILAITNEAGIGYDLERINEATKKAPYLSKTTPSSSYSMYDVHEAGGCLIITNGLVRKERTLHPDRLTVTGKTLRENNQDKEVKNFDVIRSLGVPYDKEGELPVLFGNIAPKDAVIKIGGVDPSIKAFKGKAVCFDSHDAIIGAIDNKTARGGHVIVIRYEGPKGGPSMPEMLAPASSIVGRGLGKDVTLTTDGRLSGATRGIAVGHTSSETASGGPIGLIRDGDETTIDLVNRTLGVNQPQEELHKRKEEFEPFEAKVKTGYLARYTVLMANADTGGIIQVPGNLI